MKLSEEDEVVAVLSASDDDEADDRLRSGLYHPLSGQPCPADLPALQRRKGDEPQRRSMSFPPVCGQDSAQLLAISDQCAMKRIRLSDIPVLGRPTRGIRLCKRVKSKPYVLAHIRALQLHDSFMLVHDGEAQLMMMEDISLMSVDATFSSPIKNTSDFCFDEPLERIEQNRPCLKEELIAEDEDMLEEDEYIDGQMSLFDE